MVDGESHIRYVKCYFAGATHHVAPPEKKPLWLLIWNHLFFQSCETKQYVQHAESQVVNTSWAMLALLSAKYPIQNHLKRSAQVSKHITCLCGKFGKGMFAKTSFLVFDSHAAANG
jgi:hypothetical protein